MYYNSNWIYMNKKWCCSSMNLKSGIYVYGVMCWVSVHLTSMCVLGINTSLYWEGHRGEKDQGFLVKVISNLCCKLAQERVQSFSQIWSSLQLFILSFMGCLFLFLFSFSMKKPEWLVCLACFMAVPSWKNISDWETHSVVPKMLSQQNLSHALFGVWTCGASYSKVAQIKFKRKIWIKQKKTNKFGQVGSVAGTH